MKRLKAFTLIELLIVVAIIAILAAIAVPNFLEAQTRAKISRCKNDLRTLATGLESYHVDTNKYPIYGVGGGFPSGGGNRVHYIWWVTQLTTPIAYLTTCHYIDPFSPKFWGASVFPEIGTGLPYEYRSFQWRPDDFVPAVTRDAYCVSGFGPDRWPQFIHVGYTDLSLGGAYPWRWMDKFVGWDSVYDPTNGTVSAGDIGRFGGELSGPPM